MQTPPPEKLSFTLPLILSSVLLCASIPTAIFPPLLLLTLPLLVVTCVFTSILHYRCWDAMEAQQRRTTPGKAVGFMFIPFFNFYWAFVTYAGLASDLGKATNTTPATGLGITLAILCICSWIPVLGILATIAAFVIWILFIRRVVWQANMLRIMSYERANGLTPTRIIDIA